MWPNDLRAHGHLLHCIGLQMKFLPNLGLQWYDRLAEIITCCYKMFRCLSFVMRQNHHSQPFQSNVVYPLQL